MQMEFPGNPGCLNPAARLRATASTSASGKCTSPQPCEDFLEIQHVQNRSSWAVRHPGRILEFAKGLAP